MEHFKVSGMTCNHCKMAITKAIQSMDPQAQIQIDLAQGLVDVESVKLSRDKIAAAIDEAGYEVGP